MTSKVKPEAPGQKPPRLEGAEDFQTSNRLARALGRPFPRSTLGMAPGKIARSFSAFSQKVFSLRFKEITLVL